MDFTLSARKACKLTLTPSFQISFLTFNYIMSSQPENYPVARPSTGKAMSINSAKPPVLTPETKCTATPCSTLGKIHTPVC